MNCKQGDMAITTGGADALGVLVRCLYVTPVKFHDDWMVELLQSARILESDGSFTKDAPGAIAYIRDKYLRPLPGPETITDTTDALDQPINVSEPVAA